MPKVSRIGTILFLALILRLVGIQFGLPYLYHADEPIVVHHALAYGTGDLHPHFFKIPPLVSYLLFLSYGFSFWVGKILGIFHSAADFANLYFKNPTFFYLLARVIFGALLGTASVFLLYQLVRKYFSEKLALTASFFLAVAFLHVRDSHYVYADIPLLFVLTLCFFPILEMTQRKFTAKDHLAAGALMGLAVGTKYNGFMIGLPYGAALLFYSEKRKILRGGLAALSAGLLVYTLTHPFTWLDFPFFLSEIKAQNAAQSGSGFLHLLTYSLNGGIGTFLLCAGILGMIRGLFIRDGKRFLFILFLVSYGLLLGFKGQRYDRYVLPLVPFLLFFAADFIIAVAERFPSASQRKVVLILVVLLAFPTLAKSLLSDFLFLQKDVRTVAKEWIEASLPENSKLALDYEFFLPRLLLSNKQYREKLERAQNAPYFSKAQSKRFKFILNHEELSKKRFEVYFLNDEKEEFDLARLKEKKIEYVLIARVRKDYPHGPFYESLKENAVLVKRFSPYRDPKVEFPFDSEPLTGGPFLWKELVARERNGQPIEIYRLK